MKEQKHIDFNGIRDINLPERKVQKNMSRFKEIDLKKKNLSFFKKLFMFLFLVVLVVGGLTYFFHSASFKINDSSKTMNFNNEILHANLINPKPGEELSFDLININFSLDKDIKSEMVEEVREKAKGKIKIINNTTKVQKLRKETRFEVDGKIFKTFKSVTIQPKSFTIKEAFADEPGNSYNLKKGMTMVIPGFKEAKDIDSYKNITGEIAEDFKGGFIGKKDIADKKDLEDKKTQLEKEVRDTMLIKVMAKLPEDYILNNDGIFANIKFEEKKVDDNLKLIANTNIKAIIFNKKDFLSVVTGLTKNKINRYDIESSAFLKFKIIDKEKISIDSLKKFNFNINGELKYNSTFNEDEFLNLVRGKTEDEFNKMVKKNYSDFNITVSIFPFWMSTIPMDIKRLEINRK